MISKLKIKAGNINHLTDARYFAAYGIEWMGFNFKSKDPNKIDIETAKTIIDWIEGPQIIAEFDVLDLDYIFQICNRLQINSIQLPIKNFTNELSDYEILWKGNIEQIYQLKEIPAHLLVENVGDTQHLKNTLKPILQKNKNTIVSLNENLEQNKRILKLPNLKAIEICGSSEQEVGLKAYDTVNDLFDFLEEAEML